MSEICPKCGLPKEICACQSIQKETTQVITIKSTKKQFNKWVTLITGLSGEELKTAGKELKHKLACGGSMKDNQIVLQGDHKDKVLPLLVAMGYPREMIKLS